MQKPRAIKATEFVEALRKIQDINLDIFAVYSHAYLESGNFQCPLTESSFNVWGIKGSYNGQSTEIPTFEIVDGKTVHITDKFRKYPNFDEGIADYFAKLKQTYPVSWSKRGAFRDFYKGLLNWENNKLVYPSWSTSPTYADDLIKCYERLKTQNDGDLYKAIIS